MTKLSKRGFMALSVCNTITVMDERKKENVQRGTPLFPAACFLDNVSESPVPLHWHDELEIIVIIKGTAQITAGTKKWMLQEGEGIFINTGVLHSVAAYSGEECILKSICWHAHLTGGREDSIFWQKYTKPLISDKSIVYIKMYPDTEQREYEKLTFLDAWQLCVDEPPGYEIEVRYKLSKVLASLMEHKNTNYKFQSEKNMRDEERLKKMLSLIHLNYGKKLTVGQIANEASISVSEAMRCFKSTLGTSPIQYVKNYRLEKAFEQMNTNQTISEIANQCGFEDMSYFGREFKKRYGSSPSDWRKNHGEMKR